MNRKSVSDRKRESLSSISCSDKYGSSHPKRRRTSAASFSISDFVRNSMRSVYGWINGEDNQTDNPTSGIASEICETEASTSANGNPRWRRRTSSSRKAPVIDLTDDSNNQGDLNVEVPDAFNVILPVKNLIGNADDVVCLGNQASTTSVENQDEEDEVTVQFSKEVERQDETDDVEFVGEVCNLPKEILLANTRSVESAREQVSILSSGISSPERSHSSLSPVDGRNHDQISISSPAPEDSISRQGTPYGLRFNTLPHNGGDPWKRRRYGIHKTKLSGSSNITSLGRNFASIRDDICARSGGTSSNVNLRARDYLMDMVEKIGGNKVMYPNANNSSFHVTADWTKPFRKTRRKIDRYDGINRVRSVLDKCLQKNSSEKKRDEQNTTKDLDRSFERQSSSEQISEAGDNASSLLEASSGENCVHSSSEVQSSGSSTPLTEFSAAVERLRDLLESLNDVGQPPTPNEKYERFVAEREALRKKEIALQEEVRIRNLARHGRREDIQEQTRRRLELVGIRPPAPKPRIKDEFPPLSDEALALCRRIWDRRLAESEELSVGFDIKLTRKDLLTLSDLDWLNDEVINFYLQLICQRSSEAKNLPKVYAFNTFFYTCMSTKGYASVRRWTRKIDIFAYDIILVPVHRNIHWCLAVIDFLEKRIDYYDSLLGRNQECLDILKNYLNEEYKDKKKQIFDFKRWNFNLRTDIPRQMNGSDCGVYLCKFAEFVSRRAPIVFTQEHMPYYRQRMVYELVRKKTVIGRKLLDL
ncbi:hypothetical protein KIN20_001885 [Parelaphostrongylus tenuis]|uniref:Ubiquitin-like protease family profile domain-containing protein n=1 Tax=Parelaphostrongylus tenuis TaxID=148309 RepID=A0AAD5LUV0_PARTN|nr:hypothetical protein KIN20_001885 [Parelaphostrongylus tenuis]